MLVYKNYRRSLLWEPNCIFMHIPCIHFVLFWPPSHVSEREFIFEMTFSLPSLLSLLKPTNIITYKRRSIRAGRAARILEQLFCGALHNNAAKSANWRF